MIIGLESDVDREDFPIDWECIATGNEKIFYIPQLVLNRGQPIFWLENFFFIHFTFDT